MNKITIPNFADVALNSTSHTGLSADAWKKQAESEAGKKLDELAWRTPEGIAVKPVFTADDLKGLDFLDPWGNRVEIVQYDQIQFTKAPPVARALEIDHIEKTDEAKRQLREKGLIEP